MKTRQKKTIYLYGSFLPCTACWMTEFLKIWRR